MTPGSFEDNERLCAEIAKLIKRDLDQQIEISRLRRRLAECLGVDGAIG